jgi:hypothetical protein
MPLIKIWGNQRRLTGSLGNLRSGVFALAVIQYIADLAVYAELNYAFRECFSENTVDEDY